MYALSGALGPNPHFSFAAVCVGIAVFLDGLDGRIARMTNTVSDFGREMDSLADLITFGVAPAVMAFAWGLMFVDGGLMEPMRDHVYRAGYFVVFLYLLCGAARLARFNIQVNPIPKNPGRPDRKYFVGLPIPAAAGVVASIVYVFSGVPLRLWWQSAAWITLLLLLCLLMISTWRYRSFKDFNLLRPRSTLSVVLTGSLIYLIWNYSQPVLLIMALTYLLSGIVVRIGGIFRRWLRPSRPHPQGQGV